MLCLSLSGDWVVREDGSGEAIPAVVPGCIHTDLLRQGKIPDPHLRDNEREEAQWISDCAWDYERTFDVDPQWLEMDNVLLRCEGLDTLATVFVNGAEVGRADNFHRTWEFDVKNVLKKCRNTIRIHFASIIPFITQMDEEERRMPVWKQPGGEHRYQWIRKPAAHFGWDWGPCLMTSGIFRDIKIIAFSTARIDEVIVNQTHAGGQVHIDTDVQFDGAAVADAVLSRNGETVGRGLSFDIEKPAFWWPSGMGGQPLYNLEVTLKDLGGKVLDIWTRRIGLRTMELVCEDDMHGQGMEFRVNGIPFFAKGACWIPADSFPDRVTPDIYRQRLGDAAAANMNMIRVWGGGYYEQDVFYDLCDELGLVVWQDFMFACAGYPAHSDAFLTNVKAEAVDNVRRLRHHPCLVLWCGNNELELGHDWGLNLVGDEDGKMPWQDYCRLFDELLKDAVIQYDPGRPYWPSSPHTPVGNRANACDPRSGNAHFWYVGHWEKRPIEYYRTSRHRFVSEFGLQSFPEPRTMNAVTLPEERDLTSSMMKYRQRSGAGNELIMHYLLDWFQRPKDTPTLFWVSQILQGIGVKCGVEHWRRNRPHCMGALYWQLNDIWAAPTWSSIDARGRWKALHHMARGFFAPVLASVVENPETLTYEVWITSDRLREEQGELEITLMTADGAQVQTRTHRVPIPAAESRMVVKGSVEDFLNQHGVRNTLLFVKFSENGEVLSENFAAFVKPKHLELLDPGLEATLHMLGPTTAELTLTARHPALWTWVECLDDDLEIRCSSNFFHTHGNAARQVIIEFSQALPAEELAGRLHVRSLHDTCHADSMGAPVSVIRE